MTAAVQPSVAKRVDKQKNDAAAKRGRLEEALFFRLLSRLRALIA